MSNFRVDSSYQQAVTVTPSDTTNIVRPQGQTFTKGIYVGTTGNVTAVMSDNVAVLFSNVPVGFHAISAIRINATGTTATDILALY